MPETQRLAEETQRALNTEGDPCAILAQLGTALQLAVQAIEAFAPTSAATQVVPAWSEPTPIARRLFQDGLPGLLAALDGAITRGR